MKIKPLEKEIKKVILDYLKVNKIFCWNNRTIGIRKAGGGFIPAGMVGLSDILGILSDGRFLAIEVKRPGGLPTTPQIEFMSRINENKGLAFVCSSLDEVISVLKNGGYLKE